MKQEELHGTLEGQVQSTVPGMDSLEGHGLGSAALTGSTGKPGGQQIIQDPALHPGTNEDKWVVAAVKQWYQPTNGLPKYEY